METSRSTIVGPIIVNGSKVVRPSQELIARVGPTFKAGRGAGEGYLDHSRGRELDESEGT